MTPNILPKVHINVRQEPNANTNAAYKICDLAFKNLKV
jgi:hypothetical protein